jgi:hypothetical protein
MTIRNRIPTRLPPLLLAVLGTCALACSVGATAPPVPDGPDPPRVDEQAARLVWEPDGGVTMAWIGTSSESSGSAGGTVTAPKGRSGL